MNTRLFFVVLAMAAVPLATSGCGKGSGLPKVGTEASPSATASWPESNYRLTDDICDAVDFSMLESRLGPPGPRDPTRISFENANFEFTGGVKCFQKYPEIKDRDANFAQIFFASFKSEVGARLAYDPFPAVQATGTVLGTLSIGVDDMQFASVDGEETIRIRDGNLYVEIQIPAGKGVAAEPGSGSSLSPSSEQFASHVIEKLRGVAQV